MEDNRINRKKTKKRRKRKIILSVSILFLLSLIAYVTYEYMAGKSSALDQQGENNNETNIEYKENFQGEEDSFGKTNVLILGVDSRGEENSRTDTIMIGQYDPDKESGKLASIMRDTYVNIPGYGYNKINNAFFFGGPELLRQTIKENFGISVEYYAIVDFQGFVQVVDTIAPDGIEIEVEKYMSKNIDVVLQPGLQALNGEELLGYARFRADSDNDFGRVARQQKVMSKLKDEMLSFAGLLKLPRVVGTLQPYIDTNMKTGTMISLGKDFVLNPVDDIETMRIPVDGTFWDETYEHAGAVLAIDEAKNKEALQEFLQ
ncbi:LCP family protein required for cell wall assembly [Salirhabdus euzebyi]|uniref:Regulatory protein MsrR n=1 Tax=Salirhabdus euzebyi TaxID=394506 RepID=A0A841Q3Q6_9BACI|nr:LCP family protein [Salirhabdus euzebyi]MBB6453036.1 LCP family protein required for cell wall assembly [Salirhabdus euzebyi]